MTVIVYEPQQPEIERKRSELYQLSERYGFSSPDVLALSQELDRLIIHHMAKTERQYILSAD